MDFLEKQKQTKDIFFRKGKAQVINGSLFLFMCSQRTYINAILKLI